MESLNGQHFDTVIIGAGMSGLAAGIRLALFDKNVLILERHNAPGGLNSFYSIDGRKFDVGLHAMTNFVPAGVKGTPLVKLFRQLRIARDEFDLSPQNQSRIAFPGLSLAFNNDENFLTSEIETHFPSQKDNYQALLKFIREFNENDLAAKITSVHPVLEKYITDPTLRDMLLLPMYYYGSALENDIDLYQFVTLFKSIYLEGFARPYEGVRQITRSLLKKYKSLGGLRKMKCGVQSISTANNKVSELLLDNGETISASNVISSIGLPETLKLVDQPAPSSSKENIGQLTFVEAMHIFKKQPKEFGWTDTITFFNDSDSLNYEQPKDLVDFRSGVICFPNNYQYADDMELSEGCLRTTLLANYKQWTSLPEETYQAQKKVLFPKITEQTLKMLPNSPNCIDFEKDVITTDMFTPRTIEKYTGHIGGTVYGAPEKTRDGTTHIENLYICGTDQGYLGIIGALLSGISMVNYHILKG